MTWSFGGCSLNMKLVADRQLWRFFTGFLLIVPISCHAIAVQDSDQTLYVIDCSGSLTTISLHTLDIVKQQSISELVPATVKGSTNGCLITDPYFSGDSLTADLLTKDSQYPEELGFTTFHIHLTIGKAVRRSQQHARRVPYPIRPVLEHSLQNRLGNPLQPYAENGNILHLHKSDTMGSITLVRIDSSDENGTVFATFDSITQKIHVVRSMLYANVRNLHLSAGGRQVIVEEIAQGNLAGTNGSVSRTGRVITYELATGRAVWERIIPQLTDKASRIICASSTGTLIIGVAGEQNIYLILGDDNIKINIPNDISTSCGFVLP